MSTNKETGTASVGPVEYVLIEFPGNQFRGDIAPALADLVDAGHVRIIDLVFVVKDADGNVASFEYDEREDLAVLASVEGSADGMLSDDDLLLVAEALEPDTSVLLIVWEDRWALPLAQAIRAAGGVLRGGERIPHEIVEAALEGMED